MEIKDIANMQAQRGSKEAVKSSDINTKTIEETSTKCREFIEDNSRSYRDMTPDMKRSAIRSLVYEYVLKNKPLVKGFMLDNGEPDTNKLIERLTNDITDRGKLTAPIEDPEISEIRVNGREIKVESHGKIRDLLDTNGEVVRFDSPEEQEVVIKTLIGDAKLTPKDAILSARTVEGYRVEAIHKSAVSEDPRDNNNNGYHAFVLRKFDDYKPQLEDIIVKNKSFSDDMGRVLELAAVGNLTFWTVGATGSGKTTTNNAILQKRETNSRMILIQNPSEIDARVRDEITGRVVNDVLHLEARTVENPSPHDPTVENLMVACNRLSPEIISVGEIRRPSEFKLMYDIGLDGHPCNATFHSDSTVKALKRFLAEYLTASPGEPAELVLETLTEQVDLIITQMKLRDGKRKILQISEITGVSESNRLEPTYNDLYVFEPSGINEYDDNGKLVEITGRHVRVGKISESMCNKLALAGVPRSKYEFLTTEPDGKEETYTGILS